MNKFQCLLYVYQSRHRCNGNSRLEDSDTESPSSHCRCISCPSQSTKSTPRTPTQTPENIIVKDSLPTYICTTIVTQKSRKSDLLCTPLMELWKKKNL